MSKFLQGLTPDYIGKVLLAASIVLGAGVYPNITTDSGPPDNSLLIKNAELTIIVTELAKRVSVLERHTGSDNHPPSQYEKEIDRRIRALKDDILREKAERMREIDKLDRNLNGRNAPTR